MLSKREERQQSVWRAVKQRSDWRQQVQEREAQDAWGPPLDRQEPRGAWEERNGSSSCNLSVAS